MIIPEPVPEGADFNDIELAVRPPPILAEVIGSDCARAEGISAFGEAPVLRLCRALLKAGHDPARPLEAYRGDVMCLRVRSIGEGAGLEIASNGVGFRPRSRAGTDSPMRSIESPALSPLDAAENASAAPGESHG
jgi:hypothetical protein